MENWSEKRHSTRAVQATLMLAFRQPFSTRDAQNAGADSKPLNPAATHPRALHPRSSPRPHAPPFRLRH
ncbi:hypothetical protein G6F57_011676 [Rhizopus arrhizus]|nr:hypothetical protein G6F24_018020 [Rhizopus arrhizus]KAG1470742.1 hypothetical protein G6F57_011676 [Rhizopus arrhizus]